MYIAQIIITVLLTLIFKNFLPWWSIALAGFLGQFIVKLGKFKIFLGGFTSIASLWMIYASVIDVQTNYVVSLTVAPIFKFNNSVFLILFTGFIGGIIGGISALSGCYVKELIFHKKEDKKEDILC